MGFRLKNIIIVILLCGIMLGYSFSNEFELSPASWAIFKYHCNKDIEIKIKKWNDDFLAFASVIKFNTWNLFLTHNSINPFFTNNTGSSVLTGLGLYSTEWASMLGWTSDMWVADFTIQTKSWFKGDFISLNFVNSGWNAPSFWLGTTDDGIFITSPDRPGDTLTWVTNATYYFEAYPCIDDTNPPIVFNNSWSPNINGWRILWSWNTIKVLVLDWIWNKGHYWYQGLATDIDNYVLAPNNVDNQNWVNSWTISVQINNSANGWNIETPILNIYPYTGSELPNKWTWHSMDRGYWVEFQNEIPFEIEKQVTITITWYDNENRLKQSFLMNKFFVFNRSENPIINIINPINASTGQDYNLSGIYFNARDSWAWVDTGKVYITIPAIYSGTELLLTWYTYSWSDLEFTWVNWTPEAGGSSSYDIKLKPKRRFPSNTKIIITGMVVDLAWNTGYKSWHFFTEPTCKDLGCFDFLNINFLTGIYSTYNPRLFTWKYLVVTWLSYNTNYPYFTWTDWDTLVCGFDYEWTMLTWNVDIYSNTWIMINWHFYTWKELYITWLDFTYNEWIITVAD